MLQEQWIQSWQFEQSKRKFYTLKFLAFDIIEIFPLQAKSIQCDLLKCHLNLLIMLLIDHVNGLLRILIAPGTRDMF